MVEKRKIMLVDDEIDFLEIMGKFFKRREIDFETAGGCLEALDRLGQDNFDVVIMDVRMPGLNGLECMVEMKKVQPELEVIILTGHASLNVGITGMKKGLLTIALNRSIWMNCWKKLFWLRKKFVKKLKRTGRFYLKTLNSA